MPNVLHVCGLFVFLQNVFLHVRLLPCWTHLREKENGCWALDVWFYVCIMVTVGIKCINIHLNTLKCFPPSYLVPSTLCCNKRGFWCRRASSMVQNSVSHAPFTNGLVWIICCCVSSAGWAKRTQGTRSFQLSWRSAWWCRGLSHWLTIPLRPGHSGKDKDQKGTCSLAVLALCHPFTLFSSLL